MAARHQHEHDDLTFLMIFLLQNMQNWDSRAMQIKLDELLRAVKGARTELVDLENVTEAELARYCEGFKTRHLHYAEVLSKRGGKIQARAVAAEVEVEPTTQERRSGQAEKTDAQEREITGSKRVTHEAG